MISHIYLVEYKCILGEINHIAFCYTHKKPYWVKKKNNLEKYKHLQSENWPGKIFYNRIYRKNCLDNTNYIYANSELLLHRILVNKWDAACEVLT